MSILSFWNNLQESLQPDIRPASFDAAVFLFSIQDMHPLDEVLKASSWVLKPEGRLVIIIHPCFRVPRQSGWGWDKERKLNYRRIDRYLSPLSILMKTHEKGTTRSFHRPLEHYIIALNQADLLLEILRILPDQPPPFKKDLQTNADIPLFLALRASKTPPQRLE